MLDEETKDAICYALKYAKLSAEEVEQLKKLLKDEGDTHGESG